MLVEDADRELYRAKLLGRNRICSSLHTSGGAIVTRRAVSRATPLRLDNRTIGREADLTLVLAGGA